MPHNYTKSEGRVRVAYSIHVVATFEDGKIVSYEPSDTYDYELMIDERGELVLTSAHKSDGTTDAS